MCFKEGESVLLIRLMVKAIGQVEDGKHWWYTIIGETQVIPQKSLLLA
jgi:hypothetical protein